MAAAPLATAGTWPRRREAALVPVSSRGSFKISKKIPRAPGTICVVYARARYARAVELHRVLVLQLYCTVLYICLPLTNISPGIFSSDGTVPDPYSFTCTAELQLEKPGPAPSRTLRLWETHSSYHRDPACR